ncbi:DUF6152 family protein [Ramlibacter rhizophilus]|uniref:DUF4198 domain-containing protein n=1 Tax=Ramlibacter rhizophilus TaxID=1781167 RepID=A0A4Z0BZT6_9BURK|nr:DUF6152 family protein [Ramlibacter rhizophilus]TFZ04763.1 hypothetical protein EZ242_03160 [Ramlibacter rhizophilus]
MQRRTLVLAGLAVPGLAIAHHGWSSFDQDRPIWLQGKVTRVRWQNPHAELQLEVPRDLRVPADLAGRTLPAQSASVDGKSLLARAVVPTRRDTSWEVELAPLTRLRAWNVEEIKPGAQLGVLGFTFKEEKGDPVLRAEYLFVDGKVYGLRSSPA